MGKTAAPDANEDSVRHLNRLLNSGKVRAGLAMALRMVERGNKEIDFELGTIYEFGGDGVPIDLDKAASYYSRAAYLIRCDVTAIYLARVLRKQGNFESSRRWMKEVETYGRTARLELGWALFHELRPEADLELARTHFLKAALRGRFFGFFGYSRVSRRMGQPLRALAVDCLRIAIGPFIGLMIGRKARENF